MPLLLVSDANVIIDLDEGQLIDELFQLPYEFVVPDILFAEELEVQYSHLPGLGLKQKELNESSMRYVFKLVERYSGPSFHDCLALSLAKQEHCPLLTGDRRLRQAADQEGIEKRGTIWIVEQLLELNIVSVEQAKHSAQNMRQAGSRLPWDKLNAVISRYG